MAHQFFASQFARHATSGVQPDKLADEVKCLPHPLRFLLTDGLGLFCDIALFTLLFSHDMSPFIARIMSLFVGTLVTWRLNRTLALQSTGCNEHDEALRCDLATLTSRGVSYLVFSVLILTVCTSVPEVALIAGAAIGAVISYCGHNTIAFAPRKASHANQS